MQLALFYTDQEAESLAYGRSCYRKMRPHEATAHLMQKISVAAEQGRRARQQGLLKAVFERPLPKASTNPMFADLPF